VDAIVEGSVEQVGDRVRVSAQLMRAANEEHLWGRSYERQVGDALALQDEIAGDVAQEVRGALAPAPAPGGGSRSASPVPATRASAVQAYLRGRDQFQRFTLESNRRALQYYDQALALDSTFTPAIAAQATSLIILSTSPDTVALARATVTKALALDANIGEAHAGYGTLLYSIDWDWPAAERELRRAIELNPNDENAHHQYSHLLMALGRIKEAREQSDIMVALDPLAPAAHNHMAFMAYMTGDLPGAEKEERKALALDPGYFTAYGTLLDVAFMQRNWAAFPGLFEEMKAAGDPVDPEYVRLIDALQHGQRDAALRTIHSISEPSDRYPWAYTHLAEWCLQAGDRDRAFASLDTALVHHDYELLFANVDPALAPLRSDPRYAALRARMHLPN
jgi:Flp pilus assembly protein TadD